MIYKFGNMFDKASGIIIVTTNATIKENGAVVMGIGAAKEMRDKFPGIDVYWGCRIREMGMGDVYLLILDISRKLGIFQVKGNYWQKADINLIKQSTQVLRAFSTVCSWYTFNLNYPGIGNGGLTIEGVEPIIKVLPDNVHIWRRF